MRNRFDTSKVSMFDWAKLAAFIDGEGSIFIAKQTRARGKVYYKLCVCVANTDMRLMRWCKERFGGSIGKQTAKSNSTRPCYRWNCHIANVIDVLNGCMIHFVIKEQQAKTALTFQCLVNAGARKPYTSDDVFLRETFCQHLVDLKTPKLEALPTERKVEVSNYVQ